MQIVVDASVVVSWALIDESDPYADSVLPAAMAAMNIVPSHWVLEVLNGILVAERRGRITEADSVAAVNLVRQMQIEIDISTFDYATATTANLCRKYGLTSFDAAYLELAIRKSIPLATLDTKLRTACLAAGAGLFLPA